MKLMAARCGNTGVVVGSEWCGLCRVHGCEGYKSYKQKCKNKKQEENKMEKSKIGDRVCYRVFGNIASVPDGWLTIRTDDGRLIKAVEEQVVVLSGRYDEELS